MAVPTKRPPGEGAEPKSAADIEKERKAQAALQAMMASLSCQLVPRSSQLDTLFFYFIFFFFTIGINLIP